MAKNKLRVMMLGGLNEIGKNIREVRKENGLSQAMLSELVEKSPSYISYIETGAKSMPVSM